MYLFSNSKDQQPRSFRPGSLRTMPPIQYGVALLSVSIALIGTLQAPAIRSGTPFLFFFLAVTISAWYGGGWAGLFALGLAILSAAYWVLPPAKSFQLTGWQLIQLTGFLAVAGAIIGLVVALQREKKRVSTQREALQLTLASIGDAVIVTDATGTVSWLNEMAITLTGWSATTAEGRPLPEIFTLIDEQTRVPVESPVKRVLTEGHSVALGNHIALVSKDGVVRTIEDSAAPIRDEQGIIQGVVLVFHDITERKQAELALRASEEKLTKIFNASPLIVTITRLADGRLIEVNDTFVRLTGYTRAESIGRTPVEIGLWVEPAQRDAGLARLRAGRFPANSEHLFRMKDGNVRTCLIAAELLNLNEETCVMTVLTDITDWKRAEEALRASEARFAKAFRASPQAMSITRAADGVYLDANESFARLVDYPLADIIGRTSFDVGIWRDAQRRQSVNQNILEQGSNRDFEHRFYTHKGELRDIVSAGVAIEVDGEACILSLVNDVTARKKAESELRQLNEHLEQRVSMRTTELERSNQELDQFAYVASHDLKAPLRAIDQLASWISEDSTALLPAASQEHLTKLRGRIRRMERLLDDLLTYSRAGRQHHPVESIATDELVRNVIDLLAPPPGFTIQLGGTWPSLVTERVPLETVLRNIISNAIKHHDHPQTGHLAITATAQATLVEFTITDDGPGIAPQYHARIFQMFQTLKPRDQVEGSGMGLAVVKKLVDHYGGAIHVTSQLGAGATFRFTWPKAPLSEMVAMGKSVQ